MHDLPRGARQHMQPLTAYLQLPALTACLADGMDTGRGAAMQ